MKNENENKIVCDHLNLYFYHINKEKRLVVIYLELLFTGIKLNDEKLHEYLRLYILGLKEVEKMVRVGTKTSSKDDLCCSWSRENVKAEI